MNQFTALIAEPLANLLGTVLVALAAASVAFVAKKLKIEGLALDDKQEQWIREQAKHAVLMVEERMQGSTGAEKATAAATLIVDKVASNKNTPNVTDAEARDLIDSVLPQVGLGRAVTKAIADRAQ